MDRIDGWIYLTLGIVVLWTLAHRSCGGCQKRWAAMKDFFGTTEELQEKRVEDGRNTAI